jgi:hypothetical protein
MKILLDECLPIDFRHSFPNHDALLQTIAPGQIVPIP